ncbi:hypothetical protein BDZ45DRAFT_680020 [Acephala macrosclerotiorum]|nr:hypothetical protein BDZ45DRAFT_680020 [Acephala macrosclerotiorum]
MPLRWSSFVSGRFRLILIMFLSFPGMIVVDPYLWRRCVKKWVVDESNSTPMIMKLLGQMTKAMARGCCGAHWETYRDMEKR